MKKDLRVSYKNFWPGFDRTRMPQDYFFDFVLSHRYNIVNDDAIDSSLNEFLIISMIILIMIMTMIMSMMIMMSIIK
jgi:hypothetical protein